MSERPSVSDWMFVLPFDECERSWVGEGVDDSATRIWRTADGTFGWGVWTWGRDPADRKSFYHGTTARTAQEAATLADAALIARYPWLGTLTPCAPDLLAQVAEGRGGWRSHAT